jgi:amino acid transporter
LYFETGQGVALSAEFITASTGRHGGSGLRDRPRLRPLLVATVVGFFTLASVGGIFAAIPFAIWLYPTIEGVAVAAEEAKDPERTIPIAYTTGVVSLVVLAFGVMTYAGGSGAWKALSNLNDPLPQAMKT